jgi:hypothetical protein
MSFQSILLSKFFPKPCMFWLLLCPGTILEPSCLASCHPSCSPPPLSGPLGQHHSTPSAAIRRPLRGSAPQPPRSFTIQVAGQGCAISRLKACTAADTMPGSLRCRGRLPGSCPGGPAATKRVSFSDLLVSSPSSSPALPQNSPGTVFLSGEEVLHVRDRRRFHSLHRCGTCPSTGTAQKVGPLTSSPSSRGQS